MTREKPSSSSLARLISNHSARGLPDDGQPQSLSRGESIYLEGESANRLYSVESGEVALFCTTSRGTEFDLLRRRPGESFGLDGLLGGRHLLAARATRPSRVRSWAIAPIRARLEANPALLWPICADLIDELTHVKQMIADFGGRTTIKRLAAWLVEAAGRSGEGAFVSLPWGAKSELARRLMMKQETLSRLLQRFAEKRLIRLVLHGIEVLQVDELRDLGGE